MSWDFNLLNLKYEDGVFCPDIFLPHLLSLDWLDMTEARREYFMSDIPRSYTYGSGNGVRTYNSNPFSFLINETIRKHLGFSYNVCFLNRYDNQKQHLGWHADNSPEMDPKHPIAVVSFGAEREIWWKIKDYKGTIPQEQKQLLGNGSVFIMPAGFQERFFHKIPKCDHECGTRISLTFRRYI